MTEPLSVSVPLAEQIRTNLTPSRIVAVISTTVAVVALGALVSVVGHEPDKPAVETPRPAAVASAPVEHAQPIAAHSAPAVVPKAAAPATPAPKTPAPKTPNQLDSVLPGTGGTGWNSGAVNHSEPVLPSLPAASAEVPTISWPQFDAGAMQPPWSALIDSNAQNVAGTVASSISGGVGGIGGGLLDFLGAVVTATSYGNQNVGLPNTDGLAALMLGPAAAGASLPAMPSFDLTKLPPPPSFDFSKLPPPPAFDFSKLPPPPALPPPPSLDNPLTHLPSITKAIGLPF